LNLSKSCSSEVPLVLACEHHLRASSRRSVLAAKVTFDVGSLRCGATSKKQSNAKNQHRFLAGIFHERSRKVLDSSTGLSLEMPKSRLQVSPDSDGNYSQLLNESQEFKSGLPASIEQDLLISPIFIILFRTLKAKIFSGRTSVTERSYDHVVVCVDIEDRHCSRVGSDMARCHSVSKVSSD